MHIAIITGAMQGIGLEIRRELARAGYHVILTGRSESAIRRGVIAASDAGSVEGQVLDVADGNSVDVFLSWLNEAHGRIDILINNTGRVYGGFDDRFANSDAARIAEAVDNNALGAWRMMQKALPMMNSAGYGRIVNVSSGMGALAEMGAGAVPYRVSKTALHALTVIAAHEAGQGVKVNAVCPGWVRTEMGGRNADRSVDDGARGIIWAATLPGDGPSGGFFRDGQTIAW